MKRAAFLLLLSMLSSAPAYAAAPDEKSAGEIRVGGTVTHLTSVVFDRDCTHFVEPFEFTQNIKGLILGVGSDLGGQAVEAAKGGLGGIAQGITSFFGGGKNQGAKISAEMRRRAIQMNWMPMSVEVAYGEHHHKEMSESEQVLAREDDTEHLYPLAEALLAAALAQVGEEYPYKFQVFVTTSADKNALALPGGFLYIDPALLHANQRDYGTFVVSHEIAHVLLRHETRALQARMVDTIALTGGVGDLIGKITSVQSGARQPLEYLVKGKLAMERHKIDQELQADACAVRLARKTIGDDRRLEKAVRAFLATLPKEEASPEDYKAAHSLEIEEVAEVVTRPEKRHPTTPERRDSLEAMLKKLGASAEAAKPAGRPIQQKSGPQKTLGKAKK